MVTKIIRSFEVEGYDQLKEQCASLIVNEKVLDNKALTARTGAKPRLIEHVLDVFESNGFIKTTKYLGGNISIYHVHSKLRRMLT